MSVPLTLGPYAFNALSFGFTGLSRNLSTRWADIQIAGALNRLQWTGGDGDSVSIEGVIFPEEFGGMETLEGLRAAAVAGLALPLISLAGAVYGMHIIEGVEDDQSYHDANGLPRKNVYRLRLRYTPEDPGAVISIVSTIFG
jgi:phage protein U